MNQELQDYINEERKHGTSDEVIKQRLRDNGWQDDMFLDYFFTDTSSQQESYLQEHTEKTKNHNTLIFIILGVIIVLAGGAYFAYAQGYFSFNNNTPQEETMMEESNNDIVEEDSVVMEYEAKVMEEDNMEDWNTYSSEKGFSFNYPKGFIKDKDFEDALGFYSAEDNSDFVSFTKPKECADTQNALIDFESYDIYTDDEKNDIEEYLKTGKCMSISVDKKEINTFSDIFYDSESENGETYSFAGINGNLVTSITEKEDPYFDFMVTGELGDYIFEIDVSGQGFTKEEVFSIFEGVAKSLKIDKSLTTKLDPFADTDEDGLYDSAEMLHGTDINIVDTDGDGKSDEEEVNSCYNPKGEGLMTVEYFQDYCTKSIAAEILISKRMFEIREELCTLWQPVAKDFINKDIEGVPSDGSLFGYEILLYDNIYNDYPEMCNKADSLAEEEFCDYILKYLDSMCPRKTDHWYELRNK